MYVVIMNISLTKIIYLLLITSTKAFCEAFWSSNISSSYSSSPNLSEPVNAYSSLTYSLFGLIGLCLRNNSEVYYLVMCLSFILGLSSFCHHYYYSNADWAYAADIISMELTTSMTLYYITTNHNYFKNKIINKVIGLFNLNLLTFILVGYKINYDIRFMIRFIIYLIIISQGLICFYFLIQKKKFRWLIILSSAWNGCLVSFGYYMWLIDQECPKWMHYNRFNGHAIWHITFSWALFSALHITNVSRYSYINRKIIWKPLFPRLPWFLFIVILPKERISIKDSSTSIELSEFKLLLDNSRENRRIRTFG